MARTIQRAPARQVTACERREPPPTKSRGRYSAGMLRDRLMGPPVIRSSEYPNAILSFGSSYAVNISDVKDMVAAVSEVFPQVRVTRLMHMPGGMWLETDDEIDLDDVSDGDLRHFTITGSPVNGVPSTPNGRATIRLGSGVGPHVAVEHFPQPGETPSGIGQLAERIEFIVTTSGQRRVPPWKWAEHTRLVGGLALAAVWLAVTISTWPGLHWSVVAGAALTSFGWQANARAKASDAAQASGRLVAPGRVLVDATPREQVRAGRAERRANLRVALASIAGTLVAAVLGAWATWFFGWLPAR